MITWLSYMEPVYLLMYLLFFFLLGNLLFSLIFLSVEIYEPNDR